MEKIPVVDAKLMFINDRTLRNYNFVVKAYDDAIEETEDRLNNAGQSKPQFLIDDDDEYQDQLELSWFKEEMRDIIDELKAEKAQFIADNPEFSGDKRLLSINPPKYKIDNHFYSEYEVRAIMLRIAQGTLSRAIGKTVYDVTDDDDSNVKAIFNDKGELVGDHFPSFFMSDNLAYDWHYAKTQDHQRP